MISLKKAFEDLNRKVERLLEVASPLRLAETLREEQPGSSKKGKKDIKGVPTTRISAEDYQSIRWKPTEPFQASPQTPALVEVVNDDNLVITPEMVEIINDPEIVMTPTGEVARRIAPVQTRPSARDVIRQSGQFSRANILPPLPKTRMVKRKVSAYSKEFGKQLKKLKAKHPRTPVTRLMKKAHAATRKARK